MDDYPDNSEFNYLAQNMVGTRINGEFPMPGGLLPKNEIQIILNWIEAGAQDI